ncbi:MAG: exodeoxyribonuclease VII large subunit, partial [Bacillota bacterium]|nr:exodeoxyribonuclease VII large subunit [Bacillota bacterium]
MKVIAFGRIGVFPKNGQYQLYIEDMQPDGIGALFTAFEQLKEKLRLEGLFDPQLKKPLPRYPKKIALVTSPTGAAVRDMLRILKQRYPIADVLICPVRVQGEEASPEIAAMLRFLSRKKLCDVIIAGRGGGSIEDLWAFNDERVARAIYECSIPVISAVGHEPDVTIADFTADVRAATPSNAAEIAVPEKTELLRKLSDSGLRSGTALKNRLRFYNMRLSELKSKRVLKTPQGFLQERRLTLDFLSERLNSAAYRIMSRQKERFIKNSSMLDAMSPLKVMSRGFSIAYDEKGRVIRASGDVTPGETLRVRFCSGSALCRVEERSET